MKNRLALAWILFVLIGIYCLGVSSLGRVSFAYGYRPAEAHSTLLFFRYLQPILILPFFLLSLIPRKWATIPLWFLSISICSLPFLITDDHLRALLGYWRPVVPREIKEIAMVMIIPIVAQFSVWLRLSVRDMDGGGAATKKPTSPPGKPIDSAHAI